MPELLNQYGIRYNQSCTDLLFPHFGKFIKKGEVLCKMFTVRLNTMLHNGQQSLHKASHTGTTADVFPGAIHVVGTENTFHFASVKHRPWGLVQAKQTLTNLTALAQISIFEHLLHHHEWTVCFSSTVQTMSICIHIFAVSPFYGFKEGRWWRHILWH